MIASQRDVAKSPSNELGDAHTLPKLLGRDCEFRAFSRASSTNAATGAVSASIPVHLRNRSATV